MTKSKKRVVNRRTFLKGAVAGAAALATPAESVFSKPITPQPSVPAKALATPLVESDPPTSVDVLTEGKSGSDFMVDVLKSLGIEYAPSVAGSSFRGLHESVINYGGNKNPEFITCCHEESAIAMAHGYAKIEGKLDSNTLRWRSTMLTATASRSMW